MTRNKIGVIYLLAFIEIDLTDNLRLKSMRYLSPYYDPAIGRFVSEDPICHGYNWYIYANNNPIMFQDPSGLFAKNGTIFGARSGRERMTLMLR